MRSRSTCPSFAKRYFWRDRGSATAEFAILLPAVLALVVPILGLIGWQQQQLKLWQVAGVVVRAASHGEQNATAWAAKLLPGSSASLSFSEGMVCATVNSSVTGWVALLALPSPKLCTRESGL